MVNFDESEDEELEETPDEDAEEEPEEFQLGEVDLKEGLEEIDKKVLDRKVERIKTSPFTYQQLLKLNDIVETEKRVLERQILTSTQKIVLLQQGQPGNPNMLGTNEYIRICESKKILRAPMDKLIAALGEQLSLAKMVVTFSQYIIAFQESLIKRYYEKLLEFHEIDKKIAQLEVTKDIDKQSSSDTRELLKTQFDNVSSVYGDVVKEQRQLVEMLVNRIGGVKLEKPVGQDYDKSFIKEERKSERFDESLEWMQEKAKNKNVLEPKTWSGYHTQLKIKYGLTDEEIKEIKETIQKEEEQREDLSIKPSKEPSKT